jgi:hypothetical protein
VTLTCTAVDHHVWPALGLDRVPFVWTSWDARVVPCTADAAVVERLDLAEYRAAELCAAAAYEEACASASILSISCTNNMQISTVPTEQHPTGYIVSNAEDLISLFDADFGVLVIGEGAKILGPNEHGQETLIVAEYLRLKQFK